jgi:uncharacterized membrane protein
MKLLGLVVLVAGLGLIAYGLSPSQEIKEQVIEGISGVETHSTMWYIVGGLILILGGASVALSGKSR